LFGTFPLIGDALIEWIRGDYFISDITLNRFFALHVVALPLVLIFLVVAHILALHEVGSSNPDGIDVKKLRAPDGTRLDSVAMHPYYTVKDLFGLSVFLVIFAAVVFFAPEMGGLFLEAPNFEPANPLLTPEHIAPVWYFTPYYAILRAVPAFAGTQVWGVLALFAAVLLLFFVPWLDRGAVRSIRYRGPIFKTALMLFAADFIMLGICGLKPAVQPYTTLSVIGTIYYFAFFLLMPWYTRIDSHKPEPARVRR
jgi:ubiquinol-cytochrome c reductase cytochrome b subunit